jgi:predicted 2-oxoglutarate/Fe(II)-dependent dioxygenase YbiX/peroxiredoxin
MDRLLHEFREILHQKPATLAGLHTPAAEPFQVVKFSRMTGLQEKPMISGLVRGDRMPDFQRPNPAGKTVMLYDLQAGQPMALLVFESPEPPETRAALETLARDSAWNSITRVAVVRATPAQCGTLVDTAGQAVTLLADDGAVAMHLLGPQPAGTRVITGFALDPNMRIIERSELSAGGNPVNFLQTLVTAYKCDMPRAPQLIRQQAPALIIPRVMDADTCRTLIGFFEEQGGKPSGTASIEGDRAYWHLDPKVKMRSDVYLQTEPWLSRIKEILMRRVLPEIQRCFQFQVTQHEVFKLACYNADTGGYFRPHRDNESRDTEHRRFAMTLNLNTGDYQGGQLRFPEYGPDLYQPERGDAIVFSSSLLHEVVPVTAGKRYVLIGFFFGDQQSVRPIHYA